MDEALSTLIETAKRLALLAETLERRSEMAIHQQQQAGQSLTQAVTGVRGDVDQIVHGASERITQLMQHGVESALVHGTAKYDQTVTEAATRLDGSGRAVQQMLHEVSAYVRRHIWMGYATVGGALILLILGGSLLLGYQWQAYRDARARTEAAQVDAETMAAYAQVGVTSCGGRPCVKIDAKSPRWGGKGEYVLLDIASKPKSGQAKN